VLNSEALPPSSIELNLKTLKELKMKVLNTRWKLIALVPLVAIAILSIGNRTGAVPDQNREVREAANDVGIIIQGGIVVQGGITQGQVLRFNVARLASVIPGPPNTNAHTGGVNLELRVFDSQGNILASNTYVFPQNQNGDVNGIQSSFFDLNAAQLPASAFDNTGRAQLTGIIRRVPGPHVVPGPENTCGFVASGEIFNSNTGQTLVHIAGAPLSSCREAA
jgi:hypothetical protein